MTHRHLVLDGYGASLAVQNGLLIAAPGNTPRGREAQQAFQPSRGKPASIFVTAQPGTITIDALKWLARTDTQLTILDWDGSIVSQTIGAIHKDPGIRRAQYLAQQTTIAQQIATELIKDKLERQTETLQHLTYQHKAKQEPLTRAIEQIQSKLQDLDESQSIKQLNQVEARAGGFYWRAIAQEIIAPKWNFPGRTGQHATDPINATLNYAYI